MFKLPKEVASNPRFPGGYFDPNFGLGHRSNNLLPSPQSLVGQANKWLNRYGYSDLSKEDFERSPEYISAEVGDDEETASSSKAFIALQLVNHQLFGMKVSLEDTSINSRYGNFAEDLIILPDGYGQTYLSARNTSSFNSMSFIDIPKIRLAIDIRPMRMNHSATNDGKASMIGSRQQWIPLNHPFRGQYEIFNLFQDINLGLHRGKKFPYLPSSLGGYGKEPPFRNYINFERFMKSFKQGSHSELIRNIVNRTIDFLDRKVEGMNPAKDPLLSHIVRFQSSFHDWIKGRSIYAPVTWLDVPPEVAKYQVGKLGESSVKDEVYGRLLAEGKLLSEQQLEIAVEHNELCKALLESRTIPEFKRIRDEARMRWNQFSIFSMENYGMIKELSLDMAFSKRPLRGLDISHFYSLVKQVRYNLRHLIGEEFVYWPEAMDEIYKRGPMKVSFTFSPLTKANTRGFAAPRSEYKSDYEDAEEISALPDLVEWTRNGMVGPVPRTLVNDDESIIEECAKHSYNIIVTDDKKLCVRAHNKTGNLIFRVPTSWYYRVVYFGTKHYSEYLQEISPGISWVEHLDQGSIKSFEETNFLDGALLTRPAIQKFNIWKNMDQKDPVIAEECLDFSDEPPSYKEKLLFDKRNILRQRRNKRYIPQPRQRGSWRHQSS